MCNTHITQLLFLLKMQAKRLALGKRCVMFGLLWMS